MSRMDLNNLRQKVGGRIENGLRGRVGKSGNFSWWMVLFAVVVVYAIWRLVHAVVYFFG